MTLNAIFAVTADSPKLSKENVEAAFGIDLDKFVQKVNGQFRYLAWPVATEVAMKLDPAFSWRAVCFENVVPNATGANGETIFKEYPFQVYPDSTVMVTVGVTLFGVEKFEQLPVMDQKNFSIVNPTSRDISDTTKRAVVKCLASGFGVGLELFKKEGIGDFMLSEGAPAVLPAAPGNSSGEAKKDAPSQQQAAASKTPEFDVIDADPEYAALMDVKRRTIKNFLTGSATQYGGFLQHVDREVQNGVMTPVLAEKLKVQALAYTKRTNPVALEQHNQQQQKAA